MQECVIHFPMRGLWSVQNSPADRIPSHGTHAFGSTYAVDIIQLDYTKKLPRFYKGSLAKYLLFGVSKTDCFGYGQTVHSMSDGTVIEIGNASQERNTVKLWPDLRNAQAVNKKAMAGQATISDMCGNYVIVKIDGQERYIVYAHLKPNSIRLGPGDTVRVGQAIAKLGHSGNSLAPHLHIQIIDSQDFLRANGVGFKFDQLEIQAGPEWKVLYNYMPSSKDILRCNS